MNYSNEITLDWDIDFDTVKLSFSYQNMIKWIHEHSASVLEVMMRPSATGNTHIRMTMRYSLTFDDRIVFRAQLRDDPYRISNDLIRFAKGEHTDVLFDSKVISEQWRRRQISKIQHNRDIELREIKDLMLMTPGRQIAGNWEIIDMHE